MSLSFTINVHVQNVHIHMAASENPMATIVADLLTGVDIEPEAPTESVTPTQDAGPGPVGPVDSVSPAIAASTTQDDPPRRRGRQRKCTVSDADLLAQAADMVRPNGHVHDDSQADQADDPPPETHPDETPENCVAPDDPTLVDLRNALRSAHYGAELALKFLSEHTGRTITRLGEITLAEAQSALAEIQKELLVKIAGFEDGAI